MPSEIDADEQIDKASPLVPSGVLLDPSSTTGPPPTPESVSLAAQLTPSQEEVDEAWPATQQRQNECSGYMGCWDNCRT